MRIKNFVEQLRMEKVSEKNTKPKGKKKRMTWKKLKVCFKKTLPWWERKGSWNYTVILKFIKRILRIFMMNFEQIGKEKILDYIAENYFNLSSN